MPGDDDVLVFFFNDTATTEIYTLSLHDALPISRLSCGFAKGRASDGRLRSFGARQPPLMSLFPIPALDRKSTRLNSSHSQISYAVFCLKKKTHRPEGGLREHAAIQVHRAPPRAD